MSCPVAGLPLLAGHNWSIAGCVCAVNRFLYQFMGVVGGGAMAVLCV